MRKRMRRGKSRNMYRGPMGMDNGVEIDCGEGGEAGESKWGEGNVGQLELKNKKKNKMALAGVVQWIEHQPVNQRLAGSMPHQGTCLG